NWVVHQPTPEGARTVHVDSTPSQLAPATMPIGIFVRLTQISASAVSPTTQRNQRRARPALL
ncbi:MAG: hypothetical protein WAU05_06600, partial [Nitrospira sp.]